MQCLRTNKVILFYFKKLLDFINFITRFSISLTVFNITESFVKIVQKRLYSGFCFMTIQYETERYCSCQVDINV